MDLTFERTYRVPSFLAGPDRLLRVTGLLGFLEDAAGEHAARWQLNFDHLHARGLMWVLTRYHLRLLQPVGYGDELRVVTWPSARRGRLALRDFEVSRTGGEPVAVATTAWAVLDVATRRPRAVDDVVPPAFVLDRRALADEFPPLPPLASPERELRLPVLARDLDMNRHVNHAVYLQWALEALPDHAPERAQPRTIEIAYLGEALPGEHVLAAAATADDASPERCILHRISAEQSGRELARLRTTW